MTVDITTISQFAQLGGLAMFATAVWYELRTQRAERSAQHAERQLADARHAEQISVMRESMATLVEAVRELAQVQKMCMVGTTTSRASTHG